MQFAFSDDAQTDGLQPADTVALAASRAPARPADLRPGTTCTRDRPEVSEAAFHLQPPSRTFPMQLHRKFTTDGKLKLLLDYLQLV